MNTKASINGIAFNLQEAAYQELSSYLAEIRQIYREVDGGEEILKEREARIADLLRLQMKEPDQLISLKEVQEVIRTLGTPTQAKDVGYSRPRVGASKKGVRKRMYRDPDNRIIGGVCGGLGTYFGVDPIVFRILFVVFAFLSFASFLPLIGCFSFRPYAVIIYFLLLIILPNASTPKQKREMRGEDLSEEDLILLQSSQEHSRVYWIRRFTWIGGIFLLFISLCSLSLIAFLSIFLPVFFSMSLQDLLALLGLSTSLMQILFAFTLLYPCILLIYLALSSILRWKSRLRILLLSLSFVWVLSATLLFFFAFQRIFALAVSDQDPLSYKENVQLPATSDTLFVQLSGWEQVKDRVFDSIQFRQYSFMQLKDSNGAKSLLLIPRIRVKHTDSDSTFLLESKFAANRENFSISIGRNRSRKPSYQVKDSVIMLSSTIFNKENPFRKAEFVNEYVIHVPRTTKVILQEPLKRGVAYSYNKNFLFFQFHWKYDNCDYDDCDEEDYQEDLN